MPQDPMSLNDLPQYLKSLREKGETGDGKLVGMGEITVPHKKSYWKPIAATLLLLTTVGVGLVTYQIITPQQPPIVADKPNNSPEISIDNPTITPNVEDEVVPVKEKFSFFKWLFGGN